MLTICSLVARAGGSEDKQVQAMADHMVEYARFCMKDRDRVSPFESAFFSQALPFLFYPSHFHLGFLPMGFLLMSFFNSGGIKTRHVFPRRSKCTFRCSMYHRA